MTKGPGKSTALQFEKTRKSRQRRLEILRLRAAAASALTPEAMSKIEAGSKNPSSDPHSSGSSAESSDRSRKEENTDSGEGEGTSSGSKSGGVAYGHIAMMGRRRVMEDMVTVAPPGWMAGEYYFFAVYDGHGGARVAEKCGEKMHKCLEKHIEKAKKVPKEKDFDWEKVMVECFSSMDDELGKDSSGDEAASRAERLMGSTAAVVLVGKEDMVVANCGDSRAVLCRGGVAVPLSTDHKLLGEDHKLEWLAGPRHSCYFRSLGDHYLKPYVTSEPEVTVVRRSESDDFLIIATDGLFDVVSNEIACEVVSKCLSGRCRRPGSDKTGASEAAAVLAELAVAKGSRDNISVIVDLAWTKFSLWFKGFVTVSGLSKPHPVYCFSQVLQLWRFVCMQVMVFGQKRAVDEIAACQCGTLHSNSPSGMKSFIQQCVSSLIPSYSTVRMVAIMVRG
ncbi:hypothetical protein DH2020_005694 [Rehmannia glutinosa]|uniref:protein-serine/threonine phosphatase n=1 Tax=Rehmannia glutinosa TaxID=99300 RepID=A0ABR0XGP9_REHGL